MRRIAIVGFKGGIGKTTTCVNLAASLALRGRKVWSVSRPLWAEASRGDFVALRGFWGRGYHGGSVCWGRIVG